MRTKSNTKHTRLIALFAMILAIVGVFALVPKAAAATETTTQHLIVTNKITNPDKKDLEFDYTITVMGGDVTLIPAAAGESDVDVAIAQDGKTATFKLKDGPKAAVDLQLPANLSDAEVRVAQAKKSGFNTTASPAITGEDDTSVWTTHDLSGSSVAFTNAQVTLTTSIDPKSVQLPLTEAATLTDTVSIVGLLPQAYTVQGELVTQDGKETVATAQTEVTGAEDLSATTTAKLEYKLDSTTAEKYSGQSLVSTVKVYEKDAKDPIATHENLDDADQTVTIVAAPAPTPTSNNLTISKTVDMSVYDEEEDKAQEAIDGATTEAKKSEAEKYLDKVSKSKDDAKDREFEFTVTLTDAEGKELKGEFTYKDPDGKEQKIKSGDTVKLKSGQSITIEELPIGTKYEVVETPVDNWVVEPKDGKVTGEIKADEESKAEFVNKARGSFSIKKTVKAGKNVSDLTDEQKSTEFTFTVHFYDTNDTKNRKELEGEYSYTGDKSGTLKSGETLTLKDGEKVTFSDLDGAIYVRVDEEQKANWTANSRNLSGFINVGSTVRAEFTNTYNKTSSNTSKKSSSGSTTSRAATAKTADPTTVAPLAMSAVSLALVGAGAAVRSKRQ